MKEFIFDPGYVTAECMGDYGFDDETEFAECVLDYQNQEIVALKKETVGYYDITFADGHVLHAISSGCIVFGVVGVTATLFPSLVSCKSG